MECGPSQRGNVALEFHDWPDEVLLTGYVRTHDEQFFSEIVERHEQMVLAVCCGVLNRWQDVEDAAQQTWLVLLRKAASILKDASLKSWLHGVALGESSNMRKSKRRREKHESFHDDLARLGDEAESHETQELINTEVQRLPEKYRVPFMLHCVEDKRKREVAQELSLPEGTVASRVRKARQLLRLGLLKQLL